jgi:signal transduction histidine kinase
MMPAVAPRRRLRLCAAPPLLTVLAGCDMPTSGTGAWLLAALALLMFAGACFALGRMAERQRLVRELARRAHEAQAWRALLEGATWRTDAARQLVEWVPDADAPPEPEPASSALERALAPRRAVRDQRLSAAEASAAPTPQDPDALLIDAEPLFDDDGRYLGHLGRARRERTDARFAPAGAAAMLAAWPGAALLARQVAGEWQVWRGNPQAQVQWPELRAGQPLAPLLAGLPAAVAEAVSRATSGVAVQAEGWQCQRFDAGPAEGLLLARSASSGGDEAALGPTLSHDLRAPIRVVEGFTRIVKEDYGRLLDRVANDHLDRVLGAAARMNLMIDALLTLARLSSQPLAQRPVNLSQLAGYVVDDLRRGAPEREVEVEIEPGLEVHGDPTLLRLVLENLLGNAWKYSARVPRARISLRATHDGRRRVFTVADNGAGFDMRSADRLFGLFQRLHSQNEFAGHGVGLASVRRIVQRHGGEVWAQSEPGRGASFSFTLA